ncbi:MAG: NADH-quinone oxidoreductase subunit N [Candidatus Poseidoniales archaeon]
MDATLLFLPELLLIASIIAIPALYIATENNKSFSICANLSLFISLIVLVTFWFYPENLSLDKGSDSYSIYDHFKVDDFSQIFKIIFVMTALAVSLISSSYLRDDEPHQAEYYLLILSSTLGMLLVASATDFLTLFLGIEISAFSSYALVAFRKTDDQSTEAGAKYLLIGAFSSALTLYGVSLIYALTGTTNFEGVNAFLIGLNNGVISGNFNEIIFISSLFILAGLGFKVAIVPFHAWAPDVYQGAPTPVTALLAAASKAMGFVALFRVFAFTLESFSDEWMLVIGIIALASMTLGNLIAISQEDIGRMLAYSSIAQAGYVLVAFTALSNDAISGGIAHILVHAFMKGGAFVVVAAVGAAGLGYSIDSYKGLAKRSQLLALSMTICLLSLVGIPPFAGFISKFLLFYGVLQVGISDGSTWIIALVVAGVLNSALSLYYYLRVMRYMYIYDPTDDDVKFSDSMRYIALFAALSLFVIIPIFWESLYSLCKDAAMALLS